MNENEIKRNIIENKQNRDREEEEDAAEGERKEMFILNNKNRKESKDESKNICFLRSVEDGTVEQFFHLTQTLGKGGGPNMQKYDLLFL